MAKLERGNHFLSGFGNENFIEEFYMDRGSGLKPGTVLSENDDEYKLEIGIPFFNEKDIELRLMGNKLTVIGARSADHADGKMKEKKYKAVFYLPTDVKAKEIGAHFEDGLLTITLPKMKVNQIEQSIMLN